MRFLKDINQYYFLNFPSSNIITKIELQKDVVRYSGAKVLYFKPT